MHVIRFTNVIDVCLLLCSDSAAKTKRPKTTVRAGGTPAKLASVKVTHVACGCNATGYVSDKGQLYLFGDWADDFTDNESGKCGRLMSHCDSHFCSCSTLKMVPVLLSVNGLIFRHKTGNVHCLLSLSTACDVRSSSKVFWLSCKPTLKNRSPQNVKKDLFVLQMTLYFNGENLVSLGIFWFIPSFVCFSCMCQGIVFGLLGIDVKTCAIGKNHVLVMSKQGLVYSFGQNGRGQCGRGGQSADPLPGEWKQTSSRVLEA